MKIRNFIVMALLLVATTLSAAKMQPGATLVRQSDGTTITVRGYGDENLSYFVASDGALLCQDGTDFFVARVATDGTLASTGMLAHETSLRTAAELTAVKAQNRKLFYSSLQSHAQAARLRREPMATNSTLLPCTGSPKVLVLLVEFSDTTFSVSNPKETFDKYLNAKEPFDSSTDTDMGKNYGSVGRYFADVSFGKFTPQFDVVGPVTLAQPLKYYGAGASSSENTSALFRDACTAVDADVDFSQYDSNGDGNADLVFIIFAGYSQSISGNSTDCIYPKSGQLSMSDTFDGVKIARYGLSSELNYNPYYGKVINGVGLFCHEFSHCLGLGDIYATTSATSMLVNHCMDYWSLMDAGEYTYNGYRPTEYTAWERERLGWLTIDTLSEATDVELKPLSLGGKAYRVINDNDATGREYYTLENVQKTGWNRSARGHGMMVTHIDYSENDFSLYGAKVNATAYHPRMTLLAADGLFVPETYIEQTVTESTDAKVKEWNSALYEKYAGQVFTNDMYKAEAAGDLYPGTSATTALTDTSAPMDAWVYTGSHMGKPITDIAEAADGTVTFKFMGGTPSGIRDIATDNAAPSADIYTLHGIRVGTSLTSLPKGIYIIGGKKVVKK